MNTTYQVFFLQISKIITTVMVKIIRMPLEKTTEVKETKSHNWKGLEPLFHFEGQCQKNLFLKKYSWVDMHLYTTIYAYTFTYSCIKKNLQMCWKSYWSEYDYIHIKTNNLGCTSYIIHTNNSSNNSQNTVKSI